MTKKDKIVFRIKSLILKCRSKGRFSTAIKLRDKLKEIK
tara:strand:+ start:240 stop:356 length:117 start_codon:yes stop_codon:yes gene_type:complete